MRKFPFVRASLSALAALTLGTGCAGYTINPGHRALLFDPGNNGIRPEVLQPGWVRLACPFWTPENACPRVDDFDVTYRTSDEQFHVLSKEGLPMDVQISVSYRPIVSELYQLDTEIGPSYFDKVIGPEFRNAAIGVFSTESYQDLQRNNGDIESKIEKRLRERLTGKHLEVSSVFIKKVNYGPKILEAQQKEVVSRQETQTQNQLLENQATQTKRRLELEAETKKLELQTQTAQKKMELQAQAEQKKLQMETDLQLEKMNAEKQADAEKTRIESELRNKQGERKVAIEQAQIDKLRTDAEAAQKVAVARGESKSRLLLAKAEEAEKHAEAANITPEQVEMHAYDALGKLGGTNTTVLLGDPSKLPGWLFPHVPGFESAFTPGVVVPTYKPSSAVSNQPSHPSAAPVTWGAGPTTAAPVYASAALHPADDGL
jgi:regulator of protease activity HflC (stomatin/prohibitin superfamily)